MEGDREGACGGGFGAIAQLPGDAVMKELEQAQRA